MPRSQSALGAALADDGVEATHVPVRTVWSGRQGGCSWAVVLLAEVPTADRAQP